MLIDGSWRRRVFSNVGGLVRGDSSWFEDLRCWLLVEIVLILGINDEGVVSKWF